MYLDAILMIRHNIAQRAQVTKIPGFSLQIK